MDFFETKVMLRTIYCRYWRAFGRIAKIIKKVDENPRSKNKVIDNLIAQISFTSNPARLQNIVEEVDKIYDGCLDNMKTGGYKDDEITLAALLLAQIDTTTAYTLLSLNQSTYYTRRRRLMAKIAKIAGKDNASSQILAQLEALAAGDYTD